ncbi:hypothetical protein Z948_3204 [Sulfitobacter donghicola DSW-25 = KCTC 12864 = JCM 14565]|nr:hypothetical protein Z948_3204 [Sulfitobacter donghicola DSW-25 = KCTC 12864 = JCM 14565]
MAVIFVCNRSERQQGAHFAGLLRCRECLISRAAQKPSTTAWVLNDVFGSRKWDVFSCAKNEGFSDGH